MPSPIGHALAGATIALAAGSFQRTRPVNRADAILVIVCAGLAVAPDLDFVYPPSHRTMSHSVSAVVAVGIVAGFVARWVDSARVYRTAGVCLLAYASHLLLDWLGQDPKSPAGIQLLWPFSKAWFISPWGVFSATEIRGFFRPSTMLANASTILRELVLLGPVTTAAWLVSRQRQ